MSGLMYCIISAAEAERILAQFNGKPVPPRPWFRPGAVNLVQRIVAISTR